MSPIDIKNPDFKRYPLFTNQVNRVMNCTVEKGEVLFLPAFWWHEVQSFPDEYKRNIAVNTWYKPMFNKEFPCSHCKLKFNNEYDSLLSDYVLK